jgi:hypothetical protein
MHMNLVRSAAFFSSITVCVASGAFIGFFACGGSTHQRQVAGIVALVAGLIAVAFTIPRLAPVRRRILVAASAALLFMAAETVASACYPGLPTSWGEFIHNIVFHLQTGSC